MSDKVGNEPTGDEEKGPQQEESSNQELSPGALLAARREELDLSIEQVANHLNLAPRQIQAIESDNYSVLPGMATARGFVRSYAKLLKIDAMPLLERIAKDTAKDEEAAPLRRALPATRFAESRLSASSGNRWFSRAITIAVLLVLLFAGLFVTQQIGMHSMLPEFLRVGTGNEASGQASPATAEMEKQDGAASDSDGNTELEKDANDIEPGPVVTDSSKEPGDTSTGAVASGAATETKQVPAESAAAAPSRSLSGDAKDMLTIKLREDSWVEIKRADNSIVVSSLLKAGTSQAFKLTGPVAITIGNASGVEVTLRGKPVEMKADAKTNVARLNLK